MSVSGNTNSGNVNTGNISLTGNVVGNLNVTGNVTGGNLIAVANLTSTQQTIIGTGAYVGNTAAGNGNIIISGRNIATDIPYDPGNLISGSSSNNGAVANGRIVIGTGLYGNTSAAMDIAGGRGARLLVMDAYNVPVTTQPTVARGFLSQMYPVLTGNVTLSTTRLLAGGGQIQISGGPAGNTYNVGTPLGLAGLGSQVSIGGLAGTAANTYPLLGNTTVGHAAGILASIAVNNGNGVAGNSTIGNAFGTYNQLNMVGGGLANNWIGVASAVTQAPIANNVGNVFALYNPNNVATYGISNANNARAALNYYFLRNDDPVAQNQLGSLRSYTNYNYISPTTSGALTIDKTNSQVQQVNLTGNVTSVAFSNFVTSASDSVNTDEQEDIVRVYFNQGATGNFGVTLPTGATYHYTNGVNTITPTANTVTCMTVSAIRISSTTNYYITLDSEVSTANFVNISATGNISAGGTASVTGNITSSSNIAGGNIKTVGLISATGNITGGNITTSGAGQISAAGNITTGYALIGNVVSTGYIFSSGDAQISGNITGNSSARILGNLTVDNNIFLPGNLTGNGNVLVNGTIAGGNIFSDYEIYANTTISAGGNVTGANLTTTGVTSTSNLTVSNTSALGSITTFSQSQYALATSGTVNINKNNGQVQYLAPTNTVSIGDLQNFVATAGGTTQADTVTLVVRQGATPYTVAMPTGNAQIKYAGNVNLISSTANSMTMVSITSVNTGTNTYLVSISPEFV